MGDHSGTARVVPFFFLSLLSPLLLLLLGPARYVRGCSVFVSRKPCLLRITNHTIMEELHQMRYSSSRSCTHAHQWLAVSLLCCSRGARGLANGLIAPSPSRRLALACEEGCAYAEPLCRQSVRLLAHPLRRSSVASHDDNKMMTMMAISVSIHHHSLTSATILPRTSLIDRASFQGFGEMELVTVAAPRLRGTHEC